MKLTYKEIADMNALLSVIPITNRNINAINNLQKCVDEVHVLNEGGKMEDMNEQEEIEQFKVCEFHYTGDNKYCLTPNRFITKNEYNIFCQLLKEIIRK
jgi:hypothetical protein